MGIPPASEKAAPVSLYIILLFPFYAAAHNIRSSLAKKPRFTGHGVEFKIIDCNQTGALFYEITPGNLIEQYQVPAQLVAIDLTESSMIGDYQEVLASLKAMRKWALTALSTISDRLLFTVAAATSRRRHL